MNKEELVRAIAIKAGVKQTAVVPVLDATLEVIIEAIKSGDEVGLVGFGTFGTVAKVARKGRNPQTGEEIDIPAHKMIKFKPGKNLKGAVK
nr:HU family DNA-binding protein [Bacilli bacterium]